MSNRTENYRIRLNKSLAYNDGQREDALARLVRIETRRRAIKLSLSRIGKTKVVEAAQKREVVSEPAVKADPLPPQVTVESEAGRPVPSFLDRSLPDVAERMNRSREEARARDELAKKPLTGKEALKLIRSKKAKLR
jgi:hypothetical protein